ncbi:XK-related protein 6-like isoform X5 [Tachypleus tridentatus]|uniref:XK-related protein 6-like isoform X1 n=2 Tax=Tachypleus tridentatus TaxID=6853 RepID=UPI003FD06E24
MEKRPMVVLNPSQNSYGRQHFDQYERSDPQVTNDSDGCQIETIILDHQYPDPAYPLHHNDLMFAAKKWEEQDQFTVFSALATFVCIISYVINVGTDVAVSYFLYVEDNLWWFGLTAAATAIPSLTVNIFSIRWYVHDAKERKTHPRALSRPHMTKLDWVVRIFFHMVLLGPIIRYIDLLIYGFRSRRLRKQKRRREQNWHLSYRQPSPVRIEQPTEVNYHLLMIQEDRDTALLALLESFMESTPQLLLQVYILSQREQVPTDFFTVYLQVASVCSSLFELSWALAFYQRALRRSVLDKKNMTRTGTALQFLWRFSTIGARVFALALFASQYKLWLVPVCVGHWGIMTVWIMHQQTHFCDSETGEQRQCEEYLFNMVIGAIYLFCFLNVKDEPTRYKVTTYYVVVFVENATLIALWYIRTDPSVWYHLPALVGVFASFLFGVSIMMVYYRCCHPNGKLPANDRRAGCC